MSDLIASNLVDKENMKSDLSPVRGDVATYNFFVNQDLSIDLKVRRIKVYTRTIEDSFILGHPDNAILGTSKLGDRRGAITLVYDSGDL